MAHDPQTVAGYSFSLAAYKFYFALTQAMDAERSSGQAPSQDPKLEPIPEPGLGGRLLWAGELDGSGRAIVVAGNISGVATLAATADSNAQKQAIRDGIVDFLVTSLDEALRILKNEIRKRQTVAVCVGSAPDLIQREMLERGVREVDRNGAAKAVLHNRRIRSSDDADADGAVLGGTRHADGVDYVSNRACRS